MEIDLERLDLRRLARVIEEKMIHHLSLCRGWDQLQATERDGMVKHAANNIAAGTLSMLLDIAEEGRSG